MKQEKIVVMVSTSKTATLNQIVSRKSDNRLAIVNPLTIEDPNRNLHTTQHLYVLSDEKIKDGNWYLDMVTGLIYMADEKPVTMNCFKKIIATTNPDLWLHKETIIGNERNIEQQGIPKIGVDFVERFVKEWNNGNKIEKINLMYGWTGGAENGTWMPQVRSNGTVSISPVEERKYSKYHINMAIREAIMYPEKFMTGIVHDDKKSLAWVENELNFIYK